MPGGIRVFRMNVAVAAEIKPRGARGVLDLGEAIHWRRLDPPESTGS
jgi:hypothetical protein